MKMASDCDATPAHCRLGPRLRDPGHMHRLPQVTGAV
jgi:hypothetical protein